MESGVEQREEQPQRSVGRAVTVLTESFSGPLPAPSILEGYERIQKGAADRIIKMAETQEAHRQSLEKAIVQSNVRNEKLGMVMAFILTIVLMIFGWYLIIRGKETAGYFAVFGPIVFQAGNYIYSRRREKEASKER